MGLLHYLWSRTAASNAASDAQINWAEGQAPSSVNDSARAMMASLAGYRDDIAGAIVTGGTSTAYTVSSYQIFDTLAHMDKMVIAFTPHATNGATVTLNVDGLGAKPLRTSPGVELPAGVLILGSPYTALYNNSDAVWYLQNFYQSPYQIPIAGGMDYWGSTAPNSAFAFPAGQAISRTTYSALFAIMGTTYGTGDGSTTFNLPDKTGRVSAMKEGSATRLTSSYFGGNSTNLGAVGGSESHTLTAAQIPSIAVDVAVELPNSPAFPTNILESTVIAPVAPSGGTRYVPSWGNLVGGVQISNGMAGLSTNTSGGAHNNTPPTIICNYIIRVI